MQGSVSVTEVINKFHITKNEILLRIRNFEDTNFISSYGIKLFLPKIAGGKWLWAYVAIESMQKIVPDESIPYLEEIVENLTYPPGVCPNVSLLLYTQSTNEIYKRIYKLPGVKYAELYKVGEYNVSVPQILPKNDWQLITKLLVMSKLNYGKIHAFLYEPRSDADVKLSRLIWHKKNPKGILSIFPNFNWSIIKNYTHLHLAVATKIRPKELRRIITRLGIAANIASRFKKTYLQVEFDAWSFADIQNAIVAFQELDGLSIEGCSFAHRNRICSEWIKAYINEKI